MVPQDPACTLEFDLRPLVLYLYYRCTYTIHWMPSRMIFSFFFILISDIGPYPCQLGPQIINNLFQLADRNDRRVK